MLCKETCREDSKEMKGVGYKVPEVKSLGFATGAQHLRPSRRIELGNRRSFITI